MQSPFPYRIQNQQLWLSPERLIFWETEKALIISDLHFGKTGQVKMIENNLMIQVEDEIYPFTEQDGQLCNAGDNATIINFKNEKLIIKLNK